MSKENIRETLAKKTAALATTESDISKTEAQIERRRRAIEKAKIEIAQAEASIEQKTEALEVLREKAEFQKRRVSAITFALGEAEAMTTEHTALSSERAAEVASWEGDIKRSRAEKDDPKSKWRTITKRLDELESNIEVATARASAEYNRVFIRGEE